MSQLPPPGDPQKPAVTPARIAIWVVVGVVGIYLLVSGIVGIVAKG